MNLGRVLVGLIKDEACEGLREKEARARQKIVKVYLYHKFPRFAEKYFAVSLIALCFLKKT